MSAELCLSPGFQSTTAGGSKPLHRFINGQPKIIGIIVLVMGSAFFTFTIAIMEERMDHFVWTTIPPGFTEGTLFIICGILYILTEHNPTKKTVTVSLALSIVAVLGTCWTLLHVTPDFVHNPYHPHYEMLEDNITEIEVMTWATHYEQMGFCLEGIFVAQCIIGGIIFIVMSVLAGAALRSSNSQAIVIMTAAPNETPAE